MSAYTVIDDGMHWAVCDSCGWVQECATSNEGVRLAAQHDNEVHDEY